MRRSYYVEWLALPAIAIAAVSIAMVWMLRSEVRTRATGTPPVPMANTPVAPPVTSESPPVRASTGREPFGSLVSPDGKWLLEATAVDENHLGAPPNQYNVRTHKLELRSLDGQARRRLLVVREAANDDDELSARPGERRLSSWMPAGWSADGSRVFYVSGPATSGLGGLYPERIGTGTDLYEVEVASGREKLLFHVDKTWSLSGGVRDVDAVRNRAVVEEYVEEPRPSFIAHSKIFLTDLQGKKLKQLFALDTAKDEGLTAAVFDPMGQRIALVTYTRHGGGGEEGYDYALSVIDLVTGARRVIRTPAAFSGALTNWFDAQTLGFTTYTDRPPYTLDAPTRLPVE